VVLDCGVHFLVITKPIIKLGDKPEPYNTKLFHFIPFNLFDVIHNHKYNRSLWATHRKSIATISTIDSSASSRKSGVSNGPNFVSSSILQSNSKGSSSDPLDHDIPSKILKDENQMKTIQREHELWGSKSWVKTQVKQLRAAGKISINIDVDHF